jgi:hypothetical protein
LADASPLAAYEAKADLFIILDVARYEYPPVWVTTTDIFDAMNTPTPRMTIRPVGSCW